MPVGGVNHSISTLNQVTGAIQRTSQVLSTGSNYPSASYGGAAYSIAQRMSSYAGLATQSVQNTQNAGAMIRTAAGATSNTVNALNSIQQFLVNAANGVNSDSDRAALQQNINQMIQQIDDNSRVEYNGMNLLDGSRNGVMVAGVTGYENVQLGNMSTEALGLADAEGNSTISLANEDAIQKSLETIGSALEFAQGVNDNLQSTLQGGDVLDYSLDEATTQGAYLERLEYQLDNYTTMEENTQAAASTIESADMARRISNLKSEQTQQQLALFANNMFNHSQAAVLNLLQ